ncbi:hypothetical protein TH0551_00050 [Helicobacter pylori]
MFEKIQKEWLSNIQKDLLSGFVVGLSVIPETAGFAIMVGLDVGVAFYTTFYMAFVLSLFGARKAMISAAAGSVALILVGVVKNYGLEYAGVATLMAGVLQILLGYLKIGNLLRFIPQSVMYGFVNALGILLLMEQFKFLQNQNLGVFILLIIGILIILRAFGGNDRVRFSGAVYHQRKIRGQNKAFYFFCRLFFNGANISV